MSFQQSQKTRPMGKGQKAKLAKNPPEEAVREPEETHEDLAVEEQQPLTAIMQ